MEAVPPRTQSSRLLVWVSGGLGLVLLTLHWFARELGQLLTPFLAPFVFCLWLPFIVICIRGSIRARTPVPLLFLAGTLLTVTIIPINDWRVVLDHQTRKDARESLIREITSGHVPLTEVRQFQNNGVIQAYLPSRYTELSDHRLVRVIRRPEGQYVLFFWFVGVPPGKFQGLLFTESGNLPPDIDLGDTVIRWQRRIDKHWFHVSCHRSHRQR